MNTPIRREEKLCSNCGVPELIHSKSCCGWQNAAIIIQPGETTIAAVMSDEEKKKRWSEWKGEPTQLNPDRLTPELQRELVRILDHAHFDMDKLYRYMRKRITRCEPAPFPSKEALQETGVEPGSYAAPILAIIEEYFSIIDTHHSVKDPNRLPTVNPDDIGQMWEGGGNV